MFILSKSKNLFVNVNDYEKDFGLTPSGIKGFFWGRNRELYNMATKDVNNNVVQYLNYSQDGNKLTQTMEILCKDGSKFHKVISNEGNKKSMNLNFYDANGNIIVQENRTYEKLDNNSAISTHNGETYEIKGLNKRILKIKHNGKTTRINLNKLISSTAMIKGKELTEKNVDENTNVILDCGKMYELTKEKTTKEQKEFLKSAIKNLSGDVLLRLTKKIDKIKYYEGDDAYYSSPSDNPDGKRVLILSKVMADPSTVLHELGHAINSNNDGNSSTKESKWTDDNPQFWQARNQELPQYNNDPLYKKYHLTKFGNDLTNIGIPEKEANLIGANEVFAETFNIMNNIDFILINERIPYLLRNMPQSVLLSHLESQNR